jgi:uncharacterized membrane protein
MFSIAERAARLNHLGKIAAIAMVILLAKIWLTILFEYRMYFPANFEAAFLIGRRESFADAYRCAFYVHIISGPLTILFGSLLMISGGRSRYRRAHRLAGRLQMIIIFAALVPSGLWIAPYALAGPMAAWGFASLSLATAASAAAAVYHAVANEFAAHRRWAGRCFVLLCSPLLFRLISGGLIVMQWESEWAYRANAWMSWLLPLAIYEIAARSCLPPPRLS